MNWRLNWRASQRVLVIKGNKWSRWYCTKVFTNAEMIQIKNYNDFINNSGPQYDENNFLNKKYVINSTFNLLMPVSCLINSGKEFQTIGYLQGIAPVVAFKLVILTCVFHLQMGRRNRLTFINLFLGTYQLKFASPTHEDSGTYRCEFNQQGVDAFTDVTIRIDY